MLFRSVPLGPKLVLTRFDSSETASIFRRTASSRPDICWNRNHCKTPQKGHMISYFISILEKLDVICLWDFQSHSASGSAVSEPSKSHSAVLTARSSTSLSFTHSLTPDWWGSWVPYRCAVWELILGSDCPLGDEAGLQAPPGEFRGLSLNTDHQSNVPVS